MEEKDGKQYGIAVVASMFFDQTTGWLRWRENKGYVKDARGRQIGSRRANARGGGGDRVYTLDDVVAIAGSLHRNGILDDENNARVLRRVEAHREPVAVGRATGPTTKKRGRAAA